jgi:hypothetical protein
MENVQNCDSGTETLPPSMSRLSRQCEILNVSQPNRPPRHITGKAFFLVREIGCGGMDWVSLNENNDQ